MNLALKLPSDQYDRILAFPIIHALLRLWSKKEKDEELTEEEQDLKIHFICDKEHVEVLNLLPMQAYYHEFESEDLSNVFNAHRAIKNSIINNIDTYISFTRTFTDASIAKNLGAKNRIGFDVTKNNLFLSQKVAYQEGRHQSEIYLSLINALWEEKLETIPKVVSRDLEPIFKDSIENPYIVINLRENAQHAFNQEVIGFVNLYKKYRFIFLADEVIEDKREEFLNHYVQSLGLENTYEKVTTSNWIEVARLVSHSACFISYDSPLVLLASYCGAFTYWFNQQIDSSVKGVHYFLGECRILNLRGKSDSEVNFDEIFDEIYAVTAPLKEETLKTE